MHFSSFLVIGCSSFILAIQYDDIKHFRRPAKLLSTYMNLLYKPDALRIISDSQNLSSDLHTHTGGKCTSTHTHVHTHNKQMYIKNFEKKIKRSTPLKISDEQVKLVMVSQAFNSSTQEAQIGKSLRLRLQPGL